MAGAEIENLVKLLARLPGLGPRSARRAVLQMMRRRETLLDPLSEALRVAQDKIVTCDICGNIDTTSPCTICADPRRDSAVLCVVEDVGDLWALERAQAVKGRYHVLGGTLSALDAIGPDELSIPRLIHRVKSEGITEIILALNATIEGQTTAHYIADQLEGQIRLTTLAQGVPIGGELDYLDDGTITTALKARKEI